LLAGVGDLHRPGGAACGVAGRQVRRECCAAERDLVAILQHAVDGMLLASWLHRSKTRDVLLHRHHLCSREFLDHGVALHVIAVGVAAEYDLHIGELEPELFDVRAQQRDAGFEVAVNEDVALRRGDQERRQFLGPDEVHVPHHLMRRERRVPISLTKRQPGEQKTEQSVTHGSKCNKRVSETPPAVIENSRGTHGAVTGPP
jgi:hypothetical protein